MPTIEISDATYEKVAFAARVAGLSISEVIERLANSPDTVGPKPRQREQPIPPVPTLPVHVRYKGQFVEGTLDMSSERLTIHTGPAALVGKTFKSPSQAAIEVVRAINPERQRPETNGWRFWVTNDNQIIDRYRRH